jgi:hypothetical protein
MILGPMEALQIYSLNARETYGVIIKRIEVLTQKMEDDRAIGMFTLLGLVYRIPMPERRRCKLDVDTCLDGIY